MRADPTDRARLLRFATATVDKFGLALATCNDDDTVTAAIAEVCGAVEASGRTCQVITVDAERPLLDQLRDAAAGSVAALMVMGMDRLLLDRAGREQPVPEIDELNRSRDRLPDEVHARVVVWLSSEGTRGFARAARDLNDVVLTRFDLRTSMPPDEPFVQTARVAAARRRLFHFAAPLALSGPRGDAEYRHKIAVADAVANTDFAVAERILRDQSLAYYRGLGDRYEMDQALNQLADLALVRGRPADGLRILREEVLPLWSDGRDPDRLRQTWARIAHFHRSCGENDEALRILREEWLPRRWTISDADGVREIAELMALRGQRAAALALLRVEVEPAVRLVNDPVFIGRLEATIELARGAPYPTALLDT